MIITIDGPAGTGKTTVARRVAERLGFLYFDTGALYRAFTYQFLRKKVALSDRGALADLLRTTQFEMQTEGGVRRYFLDGEEVTEVIRSSEVTHHVSPFSADPLVRAALLERQRQWAVGENAVFEGRDMGTVVFPDAEVKIFLTASPEVRAERRYLELKKEERPTQEKVLEELRARDEYDSQRATAPLQKAADAQVVDTSFLSLEEVVNLIVRMVRT